MECEYQGRQSALKIGGFRIVDADSHACKISLKKSVAVQLVKSCSILRLKKMSGKRKSKKSVVEGVVEIDNDNLNAGDTKKQTRKSNNSRNKIV